MVRASFAMTIVADSKWRRDACPLSRYLAERMESRRPGIELEHLRLARGRAVELPRQMRGEKRQSADGGFELAA